MSEIQLPKGWVWKKLGEVVSEAQVGVVKPNSEQNIIGNGVPYIKMNNIDLNGSINTSSLVYVEASQTELYKYTLQDGDILVNTRNSLELVGKTGVFKHVAQPVLYNNNLLRLRFVMGVLPSYMNYQMTSPMFRRLLTQSKKATTNICAIYQKDLLALNVLIPPLPVQQAIVARIEELFSELEDGVRELKTALARLKTYRQAVLHHYLNNPDWERVKLSDVSDMRLGKMLDGAKNKGVAQPYLRNINVRWGTFDLSDLMEMRFEAAEEDRYGLQPGDLVVCEGGEPGRAAIWKDDQIGMKIQKALHRIRLFPSIQAEFFYHFLSYSAFNGYLSQYFTGTTIKHLTGREFAKFEFPAPDLITQTQAVSEIEAHLSGADAMEITIRQELVRAENLRQSILKQAFSGQLVTAPVDGPAFRQSDTEELVVVPATAEPVYGGQGDQLSLF